MALSLFPLLSFRISHHLPPHLLVFTKIALNLEFLLSDHYLFSFNIAHSPSPRWASNSFHHLQCIDPVSSSDYSQLFFPCFSFQTLLSLSFSTNPFIIYSVNQAHTFGMHSSYLWHIPLVCTHNSSPFFFPSNLVHCKIMSLLPLLGDQQWRH